MRRTDQRRGLLVSAIVHLMFLMALNTHARKTTADADAATPPPPVRERVFLPPAEVLRQLAPPVPVRRVPAPTPPPVRPPTPPPDAAGKDRISIGAPVNVRQKGPLELHRDDDLTKVAKGRPDGSLGATPAPPPPPTPPPRVAEFDGEPSTGPGAMGGLRLPPGLGNLPAGREGAGRERVGPGGPEGRRPGSLAAAAQREIERQFAQARTLGLPSGTEKQMGPLLFDPQGADFTAWSDQFRREIVRNWIPPKAFELGKGGEVEIEFVVERDGSLSALRILKPIGMAGLDNAAVNALRGSHWLPLPADFRPARVTIRVTFIYSIERPRQS